MPPAKKKPAAKKAAPKKRAPAKPKEEVEDIAPDDLAPDIDDGGDDELDFTKDLPSDNYNEVPDDNVDTANTGSVSG